MGGKRLTISFPMVGNVDKKPKTSTLPKVGEILGNDKVAPPRRASATTQTLPLSHTKKPCAVSSVLFEKKSGSSKIMLTEMTLWSLEKTLGHTPKTPRPMVKEIIGAQYCIMLRC